MESGSEAHAPPNQEKEHADQQKGDARNEHGKGLVMTGGKIGEHTM